MKIFIPTRGRAGHQKTSEVLNEAKLKHYIVSEDDPRAYPRTKYGIFMPCPPSKLSAKRQWILDKCMNSKLVMVDDDFTFRRRDPHDRFVKSNPNDVREMFELIDDNLDSFAHVGLIDEFMCGAHPPGLRFGGRYNGLLAYNPKFWRKLPKKDWPHFRIELNQDHDFSLQLHMLGLVPAVMCNYTKSSRPYAEGGVSIYREPKDEKRGHEILAEHWPRYVRVVKSRTSLSGYRIAVDWKRARLVSDAIRRAIKCESSSRRTKGQTAKSRSKASRKTG